MKKLILSNIRDSSIIYIIFFIIANNIIYLLFNNVSHIYILSYSITLSYSYIYFSTFLPKRDRLDSALLLQRSLPVEVDEIIRSWYLTIYIINLLIYITNIVFIIIAKKNDINNINNLLLLLLAYLISIINFNVVGPSIIKTFSTVAKVLSIVLIFTCYIVILFSTCYFYDKLTLDIIIVLDIILLIVAYITNKISVKKACEKLFVKFE